MIHTHYFKMQDTQKSTKKKSRPWKSYHTEIISVIIL